MIMRLFFLISILKCSIIVQYQNDQRSLDILKNNEINQDWQFNENQYDLCEDSSFIETQNISKLIFKQSEKPQNFKISLDIQSKNDTIKLKINDLITDKINFNLPQENNDELINLNMTCDNNKIIDQSLSNLQKVYLNVQIEQENNIRQFQFQFYKACNNWSPYSFDVNYVLLVFLVFYLINISSKSQYLKLKNENDQQNHFIFFIIATLIVVYLLYFKNQFQIALQFIILFLFTYFCSKLTKEYIEQSRIQIFKGTVFCKFLGEISVNDIIGQFLAYIIIIPYIYLQNWILNNIICGIITYATIRSISIQNLKIGIFILIIFYLQDIFWINQTDQLAQTFKIIHINVPIKIMIPLINQNKCVIFGLSDMIIPGIFMTFLKNFDRYKQNSQYHKISMISYTISILICYYKLFEYQKAYPAFIFIAPFQIIPIVFLALLRREFNELCNGLNNKIQKTETFYDQINIEMEEDDDEDDDQL